METTYRVLIKGTKPDADANSVREAIAKRFKISLADAGRVLDAKSHVVKGGLTMSKALQYRTAIEAAGANCIIEPEMQNDPDIQLIPPASAKPTESNQSKDFAAGQRFSHLNLSRIVKYGGGFLIAVVVLGIVGNYWIRTASQSNDGTQTAQTKSAKQNSIQGNDLSESKQFLFHMVDQQPGLNVYVNDGMGRLPTSTNLAQLFALYDFTVQKNLDDGRKYKSMIEKMTVQCDKREILTESILYYSDSLGVGSTVGKTGVDPNGWIPPPSGSMGSIYIKMACDWSRKVREATFAELKLKQIRVDIYPDPEETVKPSSADSRNEQSSVPEVSGDGCFQLPMTVRPSDAKAVTMEALVQGKAARERAMQAITAAEGRSDFCRASAQQLEKGVIIPADHMLFEASKNLKYQVSQGPVDPGPFVLICQQYAQVERTISNCE